MLKVFFSSFFVGQILKCLNYLPEIHDIPNSSKAMICVRFPIYATITQSLNLAVYNKTYAEQLHLSDSHVSLKVIIKTMSRQKSAEVVVDTKTKRPHLNNVHSEKNPLLKLLSSWNSSIVVC